MKKYLVVIFIVIVLVLNLYGLVNKIIELTENDVKDEYIPYTEVVIELTE